MAFTHLHVHTCYSILDGSARIRELVARAKELGFDSLAITDHGVMYGVIEFYKECMRQGIKPIIGCEVYVAPGSRFDKEMRPDKLKYHHLILLAENETGYYNLSKIVTSGFTEGFYSRPRTDKEVLRQYAEGLICTSACFQGEVAYNIIRDNYDAALNAALEYRDIFGMDNFFLEMQNHHLKNDTKINTDVMRISRETGIPVICTNDSHYVMKDDWEAHDILITMQQSGKKVSDEDRMKYAEGEFYLRSEEEMRELFKFAPEALENTHKIAERCNVEFEFGKYKIPKFDVPGGRDSYEYLRELCYEGIRERYPAEYAAHKAGNDGTPAIEGDANEMLRKWDVIEARMEHELSVIKDMGFVDYFLIVRDFVNFAKTHDVAVGPGRGSAAGSIVSYCLRIVNIDPLRYDLLFERFLNPARVTMPDIDIDFGNEGRQKVIDYVRRKYGDEMVVQIVTFGTLAARNSIRSVGRVLDLEYNLCDKVARAVPPNPKITIDQAMKESTDLAEMYNSSAEVKYLIDMSKKLEGIPKNVATHPSGVVIGKRPIKDYVPLSVSSGAVVTQYNMTEVEEIGLLKMDFLGLRNVQLIANTVKSIEKRTGRKIDIYSIDHNDKNVYEMISQGNTAGVFQLESKGMTSFMAELRPDCMDDIVAGISLYRPGPMDFIPAYISAKNNPESIVYEVPQLEKVLKSTYGCIVYQEQVMQICMELAGFTLGMADNVRRNMSKKKVKQMAEDRDVFVYGDPEKGVVGCVKNGIPEDKANHIYDEMMGFASYAFNKSHAVVYSELAYQTAYLKYYYPLDYMANLMTSVKRNAGKMQGYIGAVRTMGIKLLPPDVNTSESDFSVDGDAIRYGLSAIKSVGNAVVAEIINERESGGSFKSLEDFAERMYGSSVHKTVYESFIRSGAFDCFGRKRRQLMMAYEEIYNNILKDKKKSIHGQMNFFDVSGDDDFTIRAEYPDVPEFRKEELLIGEKAMLGLYVSGHPLDDYKDMVLAYSDVRSSDFMIEAEEDEDASAGLQAEEDGGEMNIFDGQKVSLLCVVDEKVVPKNDKRGNAYASITVSDFYGTVQVVVFSKLFAKVRDFLEENVKIFIRGHVQIGERSAEIIADDIIRFEELERRYNREYMQLWIAFQSGEVFESGRIRLMDELGRYPGETPVFVQLLDEHQYKRLPSGVDIKSGVGAMLKDAYGESRVIIRSRKPGRKK